MPDLEIVPATDADIAFVAANLRPEHEREASEGTMMTPLDALRVSALDSDVAFAGRMGGEPVFVAGVTRPALLSETSSAWMLSTARIDEEPLAMAVALRDLFARAHDLSGAAVFEQYVPAWYAKGIKFLRWLGWRAVRTVEFGRFCLPHVHMTHGKD